MEKKSKSYCTGSLCVMSKLIWWRKMKIEKKIAIFFFIQQNRIRLDRIRSKTLKIVQSRRLNLLSGRQYIFSPLWLLLVGVTISVFVVTLHLVVVVVVFLECRALFLSYN